MFVERWLSNSSEHASKDAFVFRSSASIDTHLSYADLYADASSVAAHLENVCRRHAPVCINLSGRGEFIRCFLGCLLAARVPVVVNPQQAAHNEDYLAQILREVSPTVFIDDSIACERPELRDVGCVRTAFRDIPRATAYDRWCAADVDEIAFIQYTSGTTGRAKGIAIRHRNLEANMRVIQTGFRHTTSQRVVNWLPFHHDMGLVGNVLQIVWAGGSCLHIESDDFIKKPIRWLAAISDFRATTSGGPDFGYRLALRRIPDHHLSGIDLDSWEVAYSGAERVQMSTIDAFSGRFARLGFRRVAFYPCYGFAETALMLTGAHETREPAAVDVPGGGALANYDADPSSEPVVSCGKPFPGHEMAILDGAGAVLPERTVGEIVARGDSVIKGYLSDGYADRFIDLKGRTWYRTGDIGFIENGELYPIGRLDDQIILKGRNVMPYEIEAHVDAAFASTEFEKCVIFPDADGERLVVVKEVSRKRLTEWLGADRERNERLVKQIVARVFGLSVSDVRFVVRGTIPLTTSGKIKRKLLRRMYLDGAIRERPNRGAEILLNTS